jgi:hypothetical protein
VEQPRTRWPRQVLLVEDVRKGGMSWQKLKSENCGKEEEEIIIIIVVVVVVVIVIIVVVIIIMKYKFLILLDLDCLYKKLYYISFA